MKELRELIGEAIGEASMCWSETPKGVFDSTRAKKIADNLLSKLDRKQLLESQILGLQEAMRPLLNEWAEL